MLTGEENPALASDTMFSVVMIVMNGLTGLALLLGGLRYHEQGYNFPGITAYLSLIVVLSTLGMILPNYTTTTLGPTLSRGQESFLIAMCLSLYAVFLIIQTTRHRSYFAEVLPVPERLQPLSHGAGKRMTSASHGDDDRVPWRDCPACGKTRGHTQHRSSKRSACHRRWGRCLWRSSCSCRRASAQLRQHWPTKSSAR